MVPKVGLELTLLGVNFCEPQVSATEVKHSKLNF